jgi:hypothetical protein
VEFDIQYGLHWNTAGRLVIEIVLRGDGADDPVTAPAPPGPRSQSLSDRENTADSAPQLSPSQAWVARVEDLPRADEASVGRPAGGRERLLRAAAAGFIDREVLDSIRRRRESGAPLILAPLFCTVLRLQRGDCPWICRTAVFVDAIADPISDRAVYHDFPFDVEAIVYLWTAGWENVMPAE